MLGKIYAIEENLVSIKLEANINNNLINKYVMLDDENHKFIGEVIQVNQDNAYINLLGEIIEQKFVFGILLKPSFKANVYLLSDEATAIIIGMSGYQENKELYLGQSAIYPNIKVGVDINSFFSNHFSILGSSGSGKSSGFARIIQNIFDKKQFVPYYANIFVFDSFGEYHNAFQNISTINPNIRFKSYTTNLNFAESEVLRFPVWLLDVDDLALLLRADKHSQIPILEKTLRLVNVFTRNDQDVIKYKNDIIARAILDILSSGKSSTQIRDQIISILTTYHTNELSLDSVIEQIGYRRTLKQCLLIDEMGKLREMELITSFIHNYVMDNLDLKLTNGNVFYTLEDLEKALDFALIGEGILKSDRVYDNSNILKVRLRSLINSSYNEYFRYPSFISREEYINKLLLSSDGRKAQIINFNINHVDDIFAKTITKIYSKLLFDYSKTNLQRAKTAFHIVLEEAHRYVQNDNDVNLLGYNIFERICKEGRKYGVLLGLISQRPSELSTTVLSQCSNFMIFKMIHPDDIEYIYKMIPNITVEIINRLKILQAGNCIAFGTGFKLPTLVKLNMPNPAPSSNNCDISSVWFIENKSN